MNWPEGLITFPVSLVMLLLVQRWLHRELQALLFFLTKRPAVAVGLFSLLFFPGITFHELSHYVSARLLGVRTGKLSLLPRVMRGGKLRLGYVETEQTDPVRDTLIGAAPLIGGVIAVYLLSHYALGIEKLTDPINRGLWSQALQAFLNLPRQPDFWVWLYLAFTISSTMFPSESDRRAWMTMSLAVLVAIILSILVGAGPWMLASFGPGFNQLLRFMATIFGISLLLHALIAVPLKLVGVLFTGFAR